jgi:hypothetical protein
MIYIKQKIVQRKWLNYITLHIDIDQTKANVLYHMCLCLQIDRLVENFIQIFHKVNILVYLHKV